jgi:hypothetical protein
MPIPVRSRRYDEAFYNEMKGGGRNGRSSLTDRSLEELNEDLFG